jgi:hypothetical protein
MVDIGDDTKIVQRRAEVSKRPLMAALFFG